MTEAQTPASREVISAQLLGQPYQISCTAEEKELLHRAVRLLQERLGEASLRMEKGVLRERMLLMVALNLAADFLKTGQDLDAIESRLRRLVDISRGAE